MQIILPRKKISWYGFSEIFSLLARDGARHDETFDLNILVEEVIEALALHEAWQQGVKLEKALGRRSPFSRTG
jgi:hypothetical protein